jgi:hypothetical protein
MSGVSNEEPLEFDLAGREKLVDYLTSAWLGPIGGEMELLQRNPVYTYLVGTLYPVEVGNRDTQPVVLDEEIDAEASGGEELVAEFGDEDEADAVDAEDEEDTGLNLAGAFGWAPQSMGLSFIHEGRLRATVSAGVYEQAATPPSDSVQQPGDGQVADVNGDVSGEAWKRRPVQDELIEVPRTAVGTRSVLEGRATLAWRTRAVGGRMLTTLAVSNSAETEAGKAKSDPSSCLFQVRLEAEVDGGSMHPYPVGNPISTSAEDLELELRYRDKATFAVGHGVAVDWDSTTPPTRAWTECIPTEEVPAIRARESSLDALELKWLANESLPAAELTAGLRQFLAGYADWIAKQETVANNLPERFSNTGASMIGRAQTTMERVEQGIKLLEAESHVLTSFRLANAAMRTQMLQQSLVHRKPGQVGVPLAQVLDGSDEPRWRPFQLGFILMSLASTTDSTHDDRGLVDLIWFPTGGGKTEAYLGLAAIEMIRRRLERGINGGGTAVLTRYTMRLLTAQQFQRAATLICALELLRTSDERLAGAPKFSIGLWLGNTTTPSTFKQAADAMKTVYKQKKPENGFQLRSCSWCGTSIMPAHQTNHQERYGVHATNFSFEFFCPHKDCPFHTKLPVQVVDQAIFDEPPTMLVATVDKFARLAWIDRGASLFGLAPSVFDPPSLVIQDELHLISGPLGTIVGVYEAAIRGLMSWTGLPPKVVASTATTRASEEQIRELMASEVAIFPPSGLDADDNYFSEPDPTRPGRTYVGLMPQAHTPSWAIGQISAEMLQGPVETGLTGTDKDGYWTLVVYHNSLRELGRTVTILRDDVSSNLERRAARSNGAPVRELSAKGIDEINGNVSAEDLLRILDALAVGPDDSSEALDAIATTNIMSVGIDVGRLGLMFVNGHPKSTSEYIQATSRVGRGKTPGLVVTMFRSGKPRDRSVFESFTAFHRSYYRFVEPGSVTPWSLQARRRALRAALVILMRHAGGLTGNDHASRFESDSAAVTKAVKMLADHVDVADPREAAVVAAELKKAVDDWEERVDSVARAGYALKFQSKTPEERLLKQFTDSGPGWSTMNSMRSVDRVVRVRADGER